ncbi:MAG: SPOR domain-containing protein [Magnetococcales bacterium]|nr:SPOR domain-containing protein [Magnetococcales bacterium]
MSLLGLWSLLAGCTNNLQRVPIQYAPSVERSSQDQSNSDSRTAGEKESPGDFSSGRGEKMVPSTPSVPVVPEKPKVEVPVTPPEVPARVPWLREGTEKVMDGPSDAAVQPSMPAAPLPDREPPVVTSAEKMGLSDERVVLPEGGPSMEPMPDEGRSVTEEKKDDGAASGILSTWYRQASAQLAELLKGSSAEGGAPKDAIEVESRQVLAAGPDKGGYTLRPSLSEKEVLGDDRTALDSGTVSRSEAHPEEVSGGDMMAAASREEPKVDGAGEGSSAVGGFFGKLFGSGNKEPEPVVSGVDQVVPDQDGSEGGVSPWQSGTMTDSGSGYYLPVGAFPDGESADQLAKQLKKLNVPFLRQQARVAGEVVHKVFVGPMADRKDAEAMAKDLEKNKIQVGSITNHLE